MNGFRIADCGDGVTAISPFMSCAQGLGKVSFNLRDSLWGVGVAMMRRAALRRVGSENYLDTIPKGGGSCHD
jgi:hypothetical protein